MLMSVPGRFDVLVTSTPLTRPLSASVGLTVMASVILSPEIDSIDPVRSFF